MDKNPENNRLDSNLELPSTLVSTDVEASPEPSRARFQLLRFNRTAFSLVVITIMILLLLGGGGILLSKKANSSGSQILPAKITNFAVSDPSLQGLNGVGSLQLGKSQSLSINGELHVNSGLIIQPTDQPLTGQAGQLYFDKTTKQPYYYNGTGFVSLASATAPLVKTPAGVRSLGGLTGAIELGNGLQVLNGKLQLSSDLLQPTTAVSVSSNLVSSVQGQTGAINFGAGSGISVNGTTITNTGLLSLGGAIGDLNIGRGLSIQAGALKSTVSLATSSSNLVITEDGNGNYSINDTAFAAGSQVTLAPLVAQLDASNRSVIRVDKTNTTGNFLQFSSSGIDKFVVTQSGAIAVGSIDYSQITNTPAPGVTSIGSTTGVIGLGTGLSLAGNTLSNTGVTSLSGTPNQVIVSASTGNIVVSLPQDLAVGSSPIFIGLGLSGNLNVGGTSTIGGDQSVGGNSAISGSSTITNGLTVSGTTSLAGNLDIGGNSAFNGNVSLAGSKTFTTGSGTISLGGPLTVSSNSNLLGSLNVASTTTLSSTLAVSGNTTLSGTLNVIGANTFTGLGTFDGGITIANNGNFSQAGTGSFSTGTGPTSIGGTLGVNGLTTLNGAVSVANSFSVSNGTGLVGNFSGRVSGGNAVANNEFVTLGQVSSLGAGNYIANGTTPQTADFNVTGSGTVSNITVTSGAAIGGTLTVASGITISSFGVGIVQSNASGVLSSGAVSRNDTNYFNATLTVGNGGTGATILAANGLLYGNGTGVVQATVAAANSILATNGTNTPGLTQTLPTAVQGNITSTGALAAGSIATGFGSISTANIIATTGTLQGGSVNSTSGFQLNGTNINTAGTLSNVAYLNQANVFSAAQTINGTLAVNAGTGIVGTFSGRVSGANAVSSNEFTTLGQITALGAGSYIANGTASQSNANFNIQALTSGTAGTIGGIIRGAAGGQTADLLQFQNSAGTVLASVSAAGSVTAPNFTGKFLGTATSTASDLQFATQINGSNPARIYADGTAIFSTVSANNFTSDTGTLSQQVITGKVNGNVNTYVQADGGAQFRYVGIGAAPGQTTNLIVSTLATNNIGFVLQGHSGQTGDLQQFLNSSGTVLSRFDASGNLGIGTVGAPAYKLDVQGGTGIVGQFSGRVIGANAVNNNEFATFGQIAGAIGGASANYIANNTSLQTSANFNISGTGTANVLQATGLDAASASILTVGGSNATSITLAQNTVIAAGKSLTVTGSTAFPTSPSEGQIYYRTDTKQLYVYANGKWQADRSSATLIVAANNSQNKEKADYVGDGTNDQNAINAAIAALPTTGGSVVLLDGTFNVAGRVLIGSANVSLIGQGSNTILRRMYDDGSSSGLIKVASGNISISKVKIDGNKTSFSNSNNNSVYSAADCSGTIVRNSYENLYVINSAGNGLVVTGGACLDNAQQTIANNIITGSNGDGIFAGYIFDSKIINNLISGGLSNGIDAGESARNTIAGNNIYSNSNTGMAFDQDKGSVIQGNILRANKYGITTGIGATPGSLYTNNQILSNTSGGFIFTAGTATITGNVISSNSGTGLSVGNVSTGAVVSNNTISSNTGVGLAINSSAKAFTIQNNTLTSNGTNLQDLSPFQNYNNQADNNGYILTSGQAGIGLNTLTPTTSLQNAGGFNNVALATPAAPTVTNVGSAATTSYTYADTAYDGLGETLPSTGTTTTNGAATLNGTDYNQIVPQRVPGAVSYRIYRTATGGSPATTGLIGSVAGGAPNFYLNDTGIAATTAVPVLNSTGGGSVAGNFGLGTMSAAYKLDVQAGSGIVGQFSGRVIGGNAVNNNEFVTLGQVNSLGAGAYVANSTLIQTANFNIQAANSSTVGTIAGIIRGAAGGQTADLLQLQSSTGSVLSRFDSTGNLQVPSGTSGFSNVSASGNLAVTGNGTFSGGVGVGTSPGNAGTVSITGSQNGGGILTVTQASGNGDALQVNGNSTFAGSVTSGPGSFTGRDASTGLVATNSGNASGSAIRLFTSANFGPGSLLQASNNIGTVTTLDNNGKLALGSSLPAYKLDVQGGTGIVAQFSGRAIGADAVNNNEFATLGQVNSLGAGNYITNQYGAVQSGNFNLQAKSNGTTGTIGGIIRGAAGGQTADLLQIQDSSGGKVASFSSPASGVGTLSLYGSNTPILNLQGHTFQNQSSGVNINYLAGVGTFNFDALLALKVYPLNSSSQVAATFSGYAGQTGDLIQLTNSSNTVLAKFDATGNLVTSALGSSSFAGSLGIGTISPAYKLDVQGGAGIVAQFSGRVVGNNAVNSNEFATLSQVTGAVGGISGNFVQNGTTQQSANFNIVSAASSSIAAVIQGATSQSVDIFRVGTAGNPNALSVNNVGNTVIGGGSSLTVTGSTAFPTSPSEGQIYYRTDTKQLYVYANGKWQADRSSATLIVAANNSQNKEKADYVGDGTNDQNAINAAIAALPTTGGSVVLLDGTFNIKSDITLNKANVLISGQGTGTKLVRQYNAAPTGDTGIFFVTVDNITITNLQIDGNKAVYTTSNNNGIGYLSATSNASTIDKVSIINCAGSAIFSGNYVNYAKIVNSSISSNANGIDLRNDGESVISNNVVTNNTGIGINAGNNRSATITTNLVKANGSGIQANTGSVVTGNVVNNNINDGIQASGTGASVSGNSLSSNGRNGIVTGNNTTVTGNQITGSGSYGISAYYANNYRSLISDNNISNSGLDGMSIGADGAIISNNYIANSGGNGGSSGITLGTGGGVANGAKIFGNTITDTSGTGYAISINSASTGVSLGNNVFSGTGASSINDLGKATIYANQLDASGNQINRNQGGLSVGTMTATNSLTLQGSFQASQLPTPSAPTVTAVGTAGTTTYTYAISALDGSGETLPSSGTVISTANATLTGTNYNTISWTQVGGAVQYKVYRIASGGTPATTGLIGTVTSNVFTFSDTGLAASSAAAASNSTGNLTIAGTIQGGGALSISGNSSLGGPLTVGLPATTGGVTVSTAGNLSVRNNNNAASVLNAVDSTGATSLEVRAGLATDMNLFVGLGAGAINTTGTGKNNVGISQYALGANTTGVQNVAIGTFALGNNVSGSNNIGIGFSSQTVNTTGGDNIALGSSSLKTNSVGSNNIAIGSLALSLATASNNTAIGTYALQNTTTGSGNTAVGASAGYNGNGSNNAILGFNSGSGAGSNNVFVGYNTGVNAGSNNIFLGNNAGAGDTGSNKLYIGSLLTGDFAANLLTLNGNLTVSGVGTSTFAGSVGISGTLTANSAFVTTSLRIGDATNNASFDATTKQLRFSGTARNDRTVSLKPQFEGGTLSADGTANAGTITSAYCSNVAGGLQVNFGAGKACANANDSHSYYEWTTTAATAQNYDVFVRYRVPSDFDNTGDFGTNASIGVYGWRTNTANDAVTTTIYNQAGQACNGDQANIGAAATWSKLDLALTGTNCDINANEYITMKIHLVAGTNDFARVGEVEINYKSVF